MVICLLIYLSRFEKEEILAKLGDGLCYDWRHVMIGDKKHQTKNIRVKLLLPL